jgi:hypothetical protein
MGAVWELAPKHTVLVQQIIVDITAIQFLYKKVLMRDTRSIISLLTASRAQHEYTLFLKQILVKNNVATNRS